MDMDIEVRLTYNHETNFPIIKAIKKEKVIGEAKLEEALVYVSRESDSGKIMTLKMPYQGKLFDGED